MKIGGIDPGREGFITVLDTKSNRGWIMKMRYCDKKILIHDDLKKLPKVDFFYLESVRGRGGWSATATFGLGSYYGQIAMALRFLGYDFIGVEPKTWVSSFDNSKGKSKERTLQSFLRFFPHEPITPRIVKNKHQYNNNLIDSIMISVYGVVQKGCSIKRWRFEYVN